jgi:hypothetical protein
MLRAIKRWLLKRRGRRLWLKYTALLEKYDCGQELAEYINPELATMRLEVESIVLRLKAS